LIYNEDVQMGIERRRRAAVIAVLIDREMAQVKNAHVNAPRIPIRPITRFRTTTASWLAETLRMKDSFPTRLFTKCVIKK
jgi:hypothetical protein